MARAPELDIGVTVGFSELFDRPATLVAAQHFLAKYNRQFVLLLLAKLSAALQLWSRPDYKRDHGLARDVFTKAGKPEYQAIPGNPTRVFFTRLGVLATARLALTAAGDTSSGRIEQPAQAAAEILACCLMMNELAMSSEAPTGDVDTDLLVHQLPNHNAMAHYHFRADLLRSVELFEGNRDLLGKHPQAVDLEQEFQRATGLTPRKFIELCLIIGAPYRAMTAGSLITDDPTFLLDKNRFGNLKITEGDLSMFFNTIARTDHELAEFLPTQGPRPLADTTVFQSWPVIRLPDEDRYYCLDIAGLLDKTGRGLYWTLFAAADKNTKGKLGGAYGLAFESYLHSRVRASGVPAARYREGPKFSNGDEVCDAIFVEGSSLIFCEYKSSVLKADAKLGGQLDLLGPELEKKFITGDEDGRKGVAQLNQGITRLLRGEEVENLPRKKWTTIIPVMVCLESAMTCPGMSGYLNRRFDRSVLKSMSSTKIAPLILIDVENFEDLLPDIQQYGFAHLIDDYYRSHLRNGRDQLVPLRRGNIPFLDDKPEPPDDTERFRKFFYEMGARIFGEQERPG
jgi:hypothetical protein